MMTWSIDSFFTAIILLILTTLYILSFIHEIEYLREKYNNKFLSWVINYSANKRKQLLSLLMLIHKQRWVNLFILCAIFVSTISPVTALMELEENVVAKSCDSLFESGAFINNIDALNCKEISVNGSYTKAALNFEGTRGHFLQIALWPAAAVVYGWILAIAIHVLRKNEDESFKNAIEKLPHVYHILTIMLAFLLFVVTYIQNLLGT